MCFQTEEDGCLEQNSSPQHSINEQKKGELPQGITRCSFWASDQSCSDKAWGFGWWGFFFMLISPVLRMVDCVNVF